MGKRGVIGSVQVSREKEKKSKGELEKEEGAGEVCGGLCVHVCAHEGASAREREQKRDHPDIWDWLQCEKS